MKKILFIAFLAISINASAQESDVIKPAVKGVVYGVVPGTEGEELQPQAVQTKMTNGYYEGKITGKVTEVCKTMGCWIKVDNGTPSGLMVKSKNHAFYMPQDLVGKTVLIEGTAEIKEVSEDKRKHFAEDAGKSKKEIAKIKGSEKSVQFIANGVKVLD